MHYQPVPWQAYYYYFKGQTIMPRSNTAQTQFNMYAERTASHQTRFNMYAERTRTCQTSFMIRERLRVTN